MNSSSHIRIPLLDEILASESLRPHFQPIVRLSGDFRPFGYESLARFQSKNPLLDPEFLFLYAARKKRTCDLDTACLRQSLRHGAPLAKSTLLFVNLHPAMLSDIGRWIGVVEKAAASGEVPLDRLVLEVTEQGSLDEPRLAIEAFGILRSLGIRLALDDVGIAYSHLSLIDRIDPSFIKISQHFGTDFEKDPTKTKIVRNIRSLSEDFGSELVLEGIETAATAEAARDMGIPLGQGFYFARPAEAGEVTAEGLSPEWPSPLAVPELAGCAAEVSHS